MLGVCVGLLALAKRELQMDPLAISKAVRMDKEALGFLVAYALPLCGLEIDPTNLIALSVFMLMVGLVLVQLQILHVNPLLGMIRFRFYQVELKNSDTVLVDHSIARSAAGCRSGATAGAGLWLLIGRWRREQMNFYVPYRPWRKGFGARGNSGQGRPRRSDVTVQASGGSHRRWRPRGIESWISRR